MQFQVPQFIETEDKIVGPLTLRQFLYLVAAGVLSVALYFTVTAIVWIVFSLILFTVALFLGFKEIEGRPLIKISRYMINYYWRPQNYVWISEHEKKKEDEMKILAPKGSAFENIILGMFLQQTWRNMQTGTTTPGKSVQKTAAKEEEKYQIFRGISGERRAARRVDYR